MKEQIELFNSNLLHDNKDIQRHLRIRSRTYEQITIKKEIFPITLITVGLLEKKILIHYPSGNLNVI